MIWYYPGHTVSARYSASVYILNDKSAGLTCHRLEVSSLA